MSVRIFALLLILATDTLAGNETRREVVCRVRCRTNPSDVTLIIKGVKESFYKNRFCGLQMFNFAPTNAKVGASTEGNDTPASPHYAAVIQQMPRRNGIQFESERISYKIGKAHNHSCERNPRWT